jgi:hypothetical protein
MQISNKTILGVGLLVVAYLIYKSNKAKSSGSTNPTPSNDSGGVVPPMPKPINIGDSPNGGVIISSNRYRFKEDYNANYKLRPMSGQASTMEVKYKSFKKGDVIFGGQNPYIQSKVAFDTISTTLNGQIPNFQMSGQIWIDVPLSKLERI